MVIPLSIGLVGRDGGDMPLKRSDGVAADRGIVELTKPAERIVFTDISERPVPSLNRSFSAPIKLVSNVSADDLQHLAAHDTDPFNRWQAVQTLATRMLVDGVGAIRSGKTPVADAHLIEALGLILADASLEPAYVAQALVPPSEADIAREIARDVDPDAIFRARTSLRHEISVRLSDALARTYAAMAVPGPYSPDAKSAGRRALRNVCLDLLAAGGRRDAIAYAKTQYDKADNMTDRIAALATLSLHDVPERTAAIEDFYARYQSDPLIVDKWLALQASIPGAETLDRVKALTRHPAFSASNPNRVRALIGSFAQANATQFNRADGAGYDFAADYVLMLDPKNPQVAARLATAFKSWRALEAGRRSKAEAALRRIAAGASLSPDVNDIVSRALAD
jgi:aminopeptidase N